jgi:hypothetical protein
MKHRPAGAAGYLQFLHRIMSGMDNLFDLRMRVQVPDPAVDGDDLDEPFDEPLSQLTADA